MNFIALPDIKISNGHKFYTTRNFSPTNINEFKMKLENCRWNSVLDLTNTNEAFNEFWNLFNTLFELQFPLCKVKFNKNIHQINNFMTPGLIISRKTKNKLHKKALCSPNQYNDHYKTYRNIYNRLIKASKQLYLEMKFKKYQKNPRKTWELLKETTFGSKPRHSPISELLIDNNVTTTPTDIANGFNEFFSTVGTNISNSVKNITKRPEEYLPDYDEEKPQLLLEEINMSWIIDVVKAFDSKSSTDLDGLSTKFLKQIIHYIAVPLTHIFNLSFNTGLFPDKFKESRVVPIFKSGDPRLCDNYNYITI